MPDLTFSVEGVEPVPYAAAAELDFRLRVANRDAQEQIHSIGLRCQIQIEATRRRYSPTDHERLLDLYGEPERWGQTMRSLLWTIASVNVPPFTESTLAHLHVPCTFDINVAVAKYFYALEGGEVPLTLLFSGTVFYEKGESGLQIAQISWESEAAYALKVEVWKALIDAYYPNTAWLCLRRDVFDRLYRYKLQRGIPTWEQALDSLLDEVLEVRRP
jgi:hypothetical protein